MFSGQEQDALDRVFLPQPIDQPEDLFGGGQLRAGELHAELEVIAFRLLLLQQHAAERVRWVLGE